MAKTETGYENLINSDEVNGLGAPRGLSIMSGVGIATNGTRVPQNAIMKFLREKAAEFDTGDGIEPSITQIVPTELMHRVIMGVYTAGEVVAEPEDLDNVEAPFVGYGVVINAKQSADLDDDDTPKVIRGERVVAWDGAAWVDYNYELAAKAMYHLATRDIPEDTSCYLDVGYNLETATVYKDDNNAFVTDQLVVRETEDGEKYYNLAKRDGALHSMTNSDPTLVENDWQWGSGKTADEICVLRQEQANGLLGAVKYVINETGTNVLKHFDKPNEHDLYEAIVRAIFDKETDASIEFLPADADKEDASTPGKAAINIQSDDSIEGKGSEDSPANINVQKTDRAKKYLDGKGSTASPLDFLYPNLVNDLVHPEAGTQALSLGGLIRVAMRPNYEAVTEAEGILTGLGTAANPLKLDNDKLAERLRGGVLKVVTEGGKKRLSVAVATTTVAGIVELATMADVGTPKGATTAVTPVMLAAIGNYFKWVNPASSGAASGINPPNPAISVPLPYQTKCDTVDGKKQTSIRFAHPDPCGNGQTKWGDWVSGKPYGFPWEEPSGGGGGAGGETVFTGSQKCLPYSGFISAGETCTLIINDIYVMHVIAGYIQTLDGVERLPCLGGAGGSYSSGVHITGGLHNVGRMCITRHIGFDAGDRCSSEQEEVAVEKIVKYS